MTGPEAASIPDQLLSANRVQQLCDVSESTLRQWVREGKIPAPMKIGRRSFWRPTVINEWLARSEAPDGAKAS